MTAYSDLESAVAAFQGGAFEYLPKPFDVDHAVALIRRATTEAPAGARRRNRRPASRRRCSGQAPAMQEVFRAIGRLVAVERDGADHRRVGHRQGAGRARAAPAQPARRRTRSSRSTPRRSRRTCSSRSSSATSAARSPARRRRAAGASSRPRAARCSSTRSATCRRTCRCGCCACCPTASTTASAATRR